MAFLQIRCLKKMPLKPQFLQYFQRNTLEKGKHGEPEKNTNFSQFCKQGLKTHLVDLDHKKVLQNNTNKKPKT